MNWKFLSGCIRLPIIELEKDNKIIYLVGMSHIASQKFYKRIKEKFENEDVLALTEGVSDKNHLLKYKLDYSPLANALGLTRQPRTLFKHQKNADRDVSEFSESTISTINFMCKVIHCIKTNTKITEFVKIDNTFKDILHYRNQVTIKNIEEEIKNNKDYNKFVVPFGGAHIKDIHEHFVNKGYVEKKRTHLIAYFWITRVHRYIGLFFKLLKICDFKEIVKNTKNEQDKLKDEKGN